MGVGVGIFWSTFLQPVKGSKLNLELSYETQSLEVFFLKKKKKTFKDFPLYSAILLTLSLV